MSNAAINEASGEWYLGVYCRKCQAPVPVFRDPGRGAAVTAGTGKLTVACPRCGKNAHYAAREVISFLVYADRALPAGDRAPVNDDHPVRDGAPMSDGPPSTDARPAAEAQPILELGPELAVDDEPALELEPEPAPDEEAASQPVLELGSELAINAPEPVDDEPALIETLRLEWLPIEPAASDVPASELVSEPIADEPIVEGPSVNEPAVDEALPAEMPVDAPPDVDSVIAEALDAAAAGEVEPAPAAGREPEPALVHEPEPPPSEPEPESVMDAPLLAAESGPVAEADPFLELVAAFEAAEPPPRAPESAAPPPEAPAAELPIAEAPISAAPAAPISAAPAPEPAPPAPPPVAPVAPTAAPKSSAPKSIAQVYRERWADVATRPQVIVELRPILRTLRARADATGYDVLARVAEQFLDYLAQVPPARQNAAAIEQYINAVFALASRGPVRGTDAVGEALAASLRAVNRHAGLYRAA